MPSPDCSTAVRGAQGWIFTARNLITATKITTSIGSSTWDLRLGHKTYHLVDFQSIYTTPPESSSSDPPCQSKIQQFVPRVSRAFNITPIISLSSLSKSSFSNLHHWKRIGLIRLSTRSHSLLKNSTTLSTRLTRRRPYCCWRHLWRHSATSTLADVIFQVAIGVILMSSSLMLTSSPNQLVDVIRWPLTLTRFDRWLFAKVDFLPSRFSLSSFSHRFHLCSPFLHILLLNEE